MEGEKRSGIIQSVERAISILKCFETQQELRITDISRRLGLHKSTAFGLVNTLEINGFLEQDENTGKYRLGRELFRLGAHVDVSLRTIVAPYLNNLVNSCQETVNLVVPSGGYILYVEKKESPHSMRICTQEGQLLPMYCTAAGKAMLAHMEEETVQRILDQTCFEYYTDHTVCSPEEIRKQLVQVRKQGYAIDREELEYGLVCIGAAIVDSAGQLTGAISVSGPASRMDERLCSQAADLLIQYTREIGQRL